MTRKKLTETIDSEITKVKLSGRSARSLPREFAAPLIVCDRQIHVAKFRN